MKLKLPKGLLRWRRSGTVAAGPAVRSLTVGRSMILANADDLAARLGNETLVVCGAARGRTSVVAYVLRRAGYFLGETLNERNHEDQDFVRVIAGVDGSATRIADRRGLRSLIAARNAAQARWGFKLPTALDHLVELEPMLRNPVFVICFRNPVAVLGSLHRYRADRHGDWDWYLNPTFRAFHAAEHALWRLTAPVILIDMDAALADPAAFVGELASTLGLGTGAAGIAAEIARPGYKQLPVDKASRQAASSSGFTSRAENGTPGP